MPFFGSNLTYDTQHDLTRGSFANPTDNVSEPTTPASQRGRNNSGSHDFLPAINFDEFQTSLGTLDTGSGSKPDLLDEFPAIGGGRVLRSDTTRARAMASNVHNGEQQEESIGRSRLSNESTFRQRLADRSRMVNDTEPAEASNPGPAARINAPAKSKRQSIVPRLQNQEMESITRSTQKPPQVGVGSNLLQGATHEQTSGITRSASLMRARRTTMNAAAVTSQPPEKPRQNAATGQTKGRSLLPSSNGSDPNTPNERQMTKNNLSGHTPGSSGNRRQSVASGRASGLGARTISPTDARRAKRMSVAAQQPPLPSSYRAPSTPGADPMAISPDTIPQQQQQQQLAASNKFFELPRLTAAPSPSLIPTRKDSSSLASNSARASPSDGGSAIAKFGYPFPVITSMSGLGGLSSKSSYASLHTAASSLPTPAASQSRVPVPKSRNLHSTGTTPPANDDSLDFGELIPPVPAIPKGYESPKEHEQIPFGHLVSAGAARKGSLSYLPSGFDDSMPENDGFLGARTNDVVRSSFESDRARHGGTRKSVVGPRSPATGSAMIRPAAAGHESMSGAASAQFRLQPDQNGRQNSNLQPLRLPPLNLAAMSSNMTSNSRNNASFPRPSQELDDRERHQWSSGMQTPDWSRTGHKTPSTPMTASKATFFRRYGDSDKNGIARSSTSHFGLRDNALIDAEAMRTGWVEDSDDTGSNGIPIPAAGSQNFSRATGNNRNAITPFASGSLPKRSGEYTRLNGRPSREFGDDAFFLGNASGSYDGLRLAKAKTAGARPPVTDTSGRSMSIDHSQSTTEAETTSPIADTTDKDALGGKKESGLRRKLSLGWRRSSSKAASRAEHHKIDSESTRREPPPRLPASAAFNGDGSLGFPTSARPSLDGGELASLSDRMRRRADAVHKAMGNEDVGQQDAAAAAAAKTQAPKTRSLHSERPQPVSNLRSSSWGTVNRLSMAPPKSLLTQPRSTKHGHTASTITALVKDDDDLAADEEMRKLTQKKRDVDNVAKQTEELMQRASPKSPINLEKILHDRHNSLNIFERGEVVEYENDGVYFTGTKSAQKIVGSLHPSSQPVDAKDDKAGKSTNYGYDDERGDYNIVFGDHLAYRYEVCDVLGKGSFGQVVRCIDHKDGGVVAIKIIRNKKRFHQQALVEVGILGKLREWVSMIEAHPRIRADDVTGSRWCARNTVDHRLFLLPLPSLHCHAMLVDQSLRTDSCS